MKKRRFFAIFTACCALAALSGCGGDTLRSRSPQTAGNSGDIAEISAPESSAAEPEQSAETGSSEPGSTSAPQTTQRIHYTDLPDVHTFTAKGMNGEQLSQANFARADVTVINFWSTTCPPCIREMPELAEFEKSLPDNVQLLTWCYDGSYYPDDAREILDDAGFTGTTIVSWDGDLQTLLSNLMYTPTTMFFDSQGNMIAEEIIGATGVKGPYTEKINAALTAMGKPAMS
ncbi:MAG: TlpA family protein disulfide reductase [Oscillospiraceae bacterium]|nr:TlpA family protein disulfide reductase [Oscillospiraceae bacterium]